MMRAMETAAAGAIFVVTLALVLTRPRGIAEAWWAAGGGLLMLALGLVSPGQVWSIIRLAQDALIFLIGMMLISAIAEQAGFFDWVASLAGRAGRGSVLRLYLFVFLTGTVITATLSLDATAIPLSAAIGMWASLKLFGG
jgi:arsenical pump membrane protein